MKKIFGVILFLTVLGVIIYQGIQIWIWEDYYTSSQIGMLVKTLGWLFASSLSIAFTCWLHKHFKSWGKTIEAIFAFIAIVIIITVVCGIVIYWDDWGYAVLWFILFLLVGGTVKFMDDVVKASDKYMEIGQTELVKRRVNLELEQCQLKKVIDENTKIIEEYERQQKEEEEREQKRKASYENFKEALNSIATDTKEITEQFQNLTGKYFEAIEEKAKELKLKLEGLEDKELVELEAIENEFDKEWEEYERLSELLDDEGDELSEYGDSIYNDILMDTELELETNEMVMVRNIWNSISQTHLNMLKRDAEISNKMLKMKQNMTLSLRAEIEKRKELQSQNSNSSL